MLSNQRKQWPEWKECLDYAADHTPMPTFMILQYKDSASDRIRLCDVTKYKGKMPDYRTYHFIQPRTEIFPWAHMIVPNHKVDQYIQDGIPVEYLETTIDQHEARFAGTLQLGNPTNCHMVNIPGYPKSKKT